MNPDTNPNLTPEAVRNPLHVMSPGEQIICNIKRHPIGLVGIYLTGGTLLLLLFLAVGFLPQYVTGLTTQTKLYAFVVALLFAFLVVLFMYIAVVVYRGNRWVVTSDSITQMSQTGLFTKQTSQLSLANLEDVTFEQTTLLQTILGYGTLKAETAGERSKFQFPYCPAPQKCAVEIIQAHEQFMAANPEGAEQQGTRNFPGSQPGIHTTPQ